MSSNFTPEEKKILDASVNFMEKCEQDILINPGPFNPSENPKISVIIPVYNASATIKKAIRSIQNQKLQEIEIILFDDCSPDNSYQIMEELQNKDPRIKLYKNETNRGVLFTRITASLEAKGKYITYLDNDDMFIRDDLFNIIYDEIEKNDYDIVEFNGYSTHDYHLINQDKNIKSTSTFNEDTLIKQPELGKLLLKKINDEKVEIGDMFLWGKIYKTDLMKKSINIFGKERYEQKILFHDDDCVNCIVFQNAKSLKFINLYGIYYYTNQESITHSRRPFQTCKDIIYFFNFLDEFCGEDEKEKIAIRLMNEWGFKVTDGLNEENTIFAKKVIEKLLSYKCIKEEIKKKVREICKF